MEDDEDLIPTASTKPSSNKGKAYADELENIHLLHVAVGTMHTIWGLIFATLVAAIDDVAHVKTYLLRSAWYSSEPEVEYQGSVALGAVSASYHFISALFHLVCFFRVKDYEVRLVEHRNSLRWWHYRIVFALQSSYLACVCGVDETRVIAVCSLVTFLQYGLLSYTDTCDKSERRLLLPFIECGFAVLFKWGLISSSLFGSGSTVPVSAVVAWALGLAFDILISLNQYMYTTERSFSTNVTFPFRDAFNWKHATTAEQWFILLEAVSLTFSTWSTMSMVV